MRHQPGTRVDRFEIIEELGEGAYAETYKALDTESGRTVVLKSPNPSLFADPAIFGRYKREAEIARSLNHPHVQGSFDLAENRSEPYIVLEFVDGVNLRTRLGQLEGPVPLPLALSWGHQLAEVRSQRRGRSEKTRSREQLLHLTPCTKVERSSSSIDANPASFSHRTASPMV